VVFITNDSNTNEDTTKDKLEQTSNGKSDKSHKRLESFNQNKRKATVEKSPYSSGVWVQSREHKRKIEDTMDCKKGECISE
jgi:hypothetical protein